MANAPYRTPPLRRASAWWERWMYHALMAVLTVLLAGVLGAQMGVYLGGGP